jgi:hypothetical protein
MENLAGASALHRRVADEDLCAASLEEGGKILGGASLQ